MSIIHDALKKVEASTAPASPEQQAQKPAPQSASKRKVYLLYAVMICVGGVLANILFGLLSPKPAPKTSPAVVIKEDIPLTVAAQAVTSSAAEEEESWEDLPSPLIVSGVFFSGDEGYALINNKIVKKGDRVGPATVGEISLQEVELENRGSVVKLSVGK